MCSPEDLISKYDDIYDLLDEFNFNIPASRDIICMLCHSIVRDAYQNVCGCKYCNKCIFQYLEMDNKYCPGHSDLCKLIIMRANITRDPATNRKIALLPVQCPISDCRYQGLLKNMDKHIRDTQCPLHEVGSKISSENSAGVTPFADKIEKMESEKDNIPGSLADINYLRNSFALQNKELIELKSEMTRLKIRIYLLEDTNDRQITTGDREMYLLRSEIDKLKVRNKILEREWKSHIRRCGPSGSAKLYNKVMKIIEVLKSEVTERKKDKIYLEKFGEDIESVKSDVKRSMSKCELCHDNYKSMEQRVEATETLLQYESIDPISDVGVLYRQVKTLQNKMMQFENRSYLKVLRSDLEERLDRTRLDLKRYDKIQEQLTDKIERFVRETQARSTDLVSSKSKLEAQVAELYRHTDLLLVGKVQLAFEEPIEWVIEDFPNKFQRATDGLDPYTMSEWFDFIDYRVRFKMYPFGADEFVGTHMSLLMMMVKKTARDTGPLDKRVTISVVDQMDGSSTVTRSFCHSSLVNQEHADCVTGEMETGPMLAALDFFPLQIFQTSERFIKNNNLLVRASAQTCGNYAVDKDAI